MSTIINVPAYLKFDGARLKLQYASLVMRSRYTGKRQVLLLPYALWSFEGSVPKCDGVDAAGWRSFLVKLEGEANTFRLPIPGYSGPSSGYTGPNGVVSGAGQTGSSLVTSGWTPNAKVLNDGDYLTVNDELKVATADVTANSSGVATIPFKPRLRASPASGATVNVSAPTVLMAAADDEQAAWDLEAPVLHSIKLKALEAIE